MKTVCGTFIILIMVHWCSYNISTVLSSEFLLLKYYDYKLLLFVKEFT